MSVGNWVSWRLLLIWWWFIVGWFLVVWLVFCGWVVFFVVWWWFLVGCFIVWLFVICGVCLSLLGILLKVICNSCCDWIRWIVSVMRLMLLLLFWKICVRFCVLIVVGVMLIVMSCVDRLSDVLLVCVG